MTSNESSTASPLENPFDTKHFITHIIEKSSSALFNEKELDELCKWLDPAVPAEEKHKLVNDSKNNAFQELLFRFIKASDDNQISLIILRSIWENNLDVTQYLNDVVAFCLSRDEQIALEACTVLKENIHIENAETKEKFLLEYDEKKFAKPYIFELFQYALEDK
jgi:hypothetical protein